MIFQAFLVLQYWLRLENSAWRILLGSKGHWKFERFIDYQKRIRRPKFRKKFKLKSISKSPVFILSLARAGEIAHNLYASFSPASVQGRETGSSVPLCRTQTLSLFMLSKESKLPLPVWLATALPFASIPAFLRRRSWTWQWKYTDETQNYSWQRINENKKSDTQIHRGRKSSIHCTKWSLSRNTGF